MPADRDEHGEMTIEGRLILKTKRRGLQAAVQKRCAMALDVRPPADMPQPMYRALKAALDDPDQPGSTLRVLDRELNGVIGHKLFTVLLLRPSTGSASRIYSSLPDVYSASGVKTLDDAPVMKRVLTSGVPYFGEDAEAIRRDFPDHEKIFALGCSSIINMPVWGQGRILGQINLLHRAGHFQTDQLLIIDAAAQFVASALLAASEQGL